MPRCVAYVAPGCTDFPSAKLQLLASGRSITEGMIREVIESPTVIDSGYFNDPERGERLWIVGKTYSERPLMVVLYPVDKGVGEWRLVTAMWN